LRCGLGIFGGIHFFSSPQRQQGPTVTPLHNALHFPSISDQKSISLYTWYLIYCAKWVVFAYIGTKILFALKVFK
jgi:hypothetical protein